MTLMKASDEEGAGRAIRRQWWIVAIANLVVAIAEGSINETGLIGYRAALAGVIVAMPLVNTPGRVLRIAALVGVVLGLFEGRRLLANPQGALIVTLTALSIVGFLLLLAMRSRPLAR